MNQENRNRKQEWAFWVMTLLFFGLAFVTARQLILLSWDYKSHMVEVSELLDFQDRLLNPKAWLFQSKSVAQNKEQTAQALTSAERSLKMAEQRGVLFALLSALFLLLSYVLNRGKPLLYHRMTISMALVAIGCLVIGILAPMLEISAFIDDLNIPLEMDILGMSISKDFFFEGRMFFYYQNKSVVELIQILLQERNYIVAYSIIGFSFLVPLLKLGATILLVTVSPRSENSLPARVVGAIGKWSMADVFVAAAFLSYLGFSNMNTGVQTESHTLIGLYFFFSYVILSICSGYFCSSALKESRKENSSNVNDD